MLTTDFLVLRMYCTVVVIFRIPCSPLDLSIGLLDGLPDPFSDLLLVLVEGSAVDVPGKVTPF